MEMAAPIDVGHLTQMLQCGICKNTLSNPKSLRCSHSFCKLCLDGLVEFIEGGSAVLKCPTCEKCTFLSCEQTTNDLQVDAIVKGIVGMVAKPPTAEEVCFLIFSILVSIYIISWYSSRFIRYTIVQQYIQLGHNRLISILKKPSNS